LYSYRLSRASIPGLAPEANHSVLQYSFSGISRSRVAPSISWINDFATLWTVGPATLFTARCLVLNEYMRSTKGTH